MVKPLEYNSGLSLEEAENRYNEVNKEFKGVKSHYSGLFSIFKKNMEEKDIQTLVECSGVLLPLGLEKSVQEQFMQTQTGKVEETLWYKIGQIQFKILNYSTRFENTSVIKSEGIQDANYLSI